MVICHLVIALQSGSFTNNLCKKPAKNIDKVRQQAAKFMQLEELRDYRNSVQAYNGGDNEKEKDQGGRHAPGRSNRYKENRGPQFHTYTPLNADRVKIMDEALNADLILTLKNLQGPKDADMFRQCQYHQNFGHTAEEC